VRRAGHSWVRVARHPTRFHEPVQSDPLAETTRPARAERGNRMRTVQAISRSCARRSARTAATVALTLSCCLFAGCGGSSNGGASTGGSTTAATSSSAASTTGTQTATAAQATTKNAASATKAGGGAAATSGSTAGSGYSLAGGCLSADGVRACGLPIGSLTRVGRTREVEKAAARFASCLRLRGTSSISLTRCRNELLVGLVLHAQAPRR
jgi:hypothetical protein